VLQMWDCTTDLDKPRKDLPCNTHIYIDLREDKLNLCVCCRSNDAWWGAYGANYVHFGVLQEWLAAALGKPVGTLVQFSWNLHLYTEVVSAAKNEATRLAGSDPYMTGVQPIALVQEPTAWDRDLRRFMREPMSDGKYEEPFFEGVSIPMYVSWQDRKSMADDGGRSAAYQIVAEDWRHACLEWLDRADARARAKETT